MNVAIATVANDIGTTVTGIQTAITMYTLVMAAFMITGGKIGQIIGRKRAFAIGSVIYGCGSLTTALAPSLPVLLIGWSLLEGLGAVLILPAIVPSSPATSTATRGHGPTGWSPRPVPSPSPSGRSSAACSPPMPPGAGCSPARS
jgi:MFS family permease